MSLLLTRGRRAAAFAAATGFLLLATVPVAGSASAVAHARIQGTGSSWASNAVNQWVADVESLGLQVDFTGGGSAQGRKDFANRITDFTVSDIGYQGHDPLNGSEDRPCFEGTNDCRKFAYEPIVAGGTAFPYQIKVNGQLVKNLRLSGETLAKIFTHKITNWSDSEITHDNNGRQLPSLPIIPVTHSEGSGSTAQFTTYLDTEYPSIWRAFTGKAGFTEYFPPPTNGDGIAQNGSDGVMNFVSSAAANGAIGYDEYSYPLAKNWPVAKVLNHDGYYTLPDQYNVAVALQHAQINMDKSSPNYLLQKLNQVYVAPEPQAYPLSSYSYALIPTASDDPRMTTAKRQTLADFLFYSICQGQQEIGPIGYSSLPINLVQASFAQTAKLKVADGKVQLTHRDVANCNNPTFVKDHPRENHLAQIAPLPDSCDKVGQGPCADNIGHTSNPGDRNGNGNGPGNGNGNGNGNGSGNGSNAGSGTGNGDGSGTGDGNGSGNRNGDGTLPGTPSGSTSIDPDTGQPVTTGDGAGTDNSSVVGSATDLAAYRNHSMTRLLAPLAVVEVLALLILPPVVYYQILRRRGKDAK